MKVEHSEITKSITSGLVKSQDCIQRLTTEEATQQISNKDQLLDKMLNFMDILHNAETLLEKVNLELANPKPKA